MPELSVSEVGRRHSTDTLNKLQGVHDTVMGLGATCNPSNTGTLPGAGAMGLMNAAASILRDGIPITESGGVLPMGASHSALHSALTAELLSSMAKDHPGGYDTTGQTPSPVIRDVFPNHIVYQHQNKFIKRGYTKTGPEHNPIVSLGAEKAQVHLAYVVHPPTTKAVNDEASRIIFIDQENLQNAEADADMAFKAGGGLALTETVGPFDEVELQEAQSEGSGGAKNLPVKLIAPGWGATGYYSPEVLKRDGPKIFKAGTHMYMNHATPQEEKDRPSGDIKNLAAVLATDAVWQDNGRTGPGLYSEAKVFSDHLAAIKEKGSHIGTSIRAYGRGAVGEADGRKGMIIEALTVGRSLDFVTKAGAGGQVFTESARDTAASSSTQHNPIQGETEMTQLETQSLQEALTQAKANAAENLRLKEQLIKRDAKEFIEATLRETARAVKLHPLTAERIINECMSTFPVTEDKNDVDRPKLAQMIADKVKIENDYLAKTSSRSVVEGLGQSLSPAPGLSEADYEKKFAEVYQGSVYGLTEAGANFAARGK